jgi:hypothetical protein
MSDRDRSTKKITSKPTEFFSEDTVVVIIIL